MSGKTKQISEPRPLPEAQPVVEATAAAPVAEAAPSTLADWQVRLLAEQEELDIRRAKLAEFRGSKAYAALPEPERLLLTRQSNIMDALSVVLGKRIALFR